MKLWSRSACWIARSPSPRTLLTCQPRRCGKRGGYSTVACCATSSNANQRPSSPPPAATSSSRRWPPSARHTRPANSRAQAVPKPQRSAIPPVRARALYSDVLLAAFSLALSLIFAVTPPVPTAPPLPSTQPGISHDEGWFLVTTADDGSQVTYFIAGNTRHSIQASDVQLERQLNPLWPAREATQDEVLAFDEGAPIGSRAGHSGF